MNPLRLTFRIHERARSEPAFANRAEQNQTWMEMAMEVNIEQLVAQMLKPPNPSVYYYAR
jgi:hypothetical protein